jgi:hypothetical protein
MMFYVILLTNEVSATSSRNDLGALTLKDTEYGIPIGQLAIIARILFFFTPLKARLCVISWIAKNRLWFAVPPMA